MSTYRARLPEEVVRFLVDGNEAGRGPLTFLADHIRDGDEFDQPGWTYFDNTAIRALRQLDENRDGVTGEDPVTGDLVMSVEGYGYVLEHVSDMERKDRPDGDR